MNFHHLAYWQDKALSLAIENRLFINGEYTAAAENETFETVDPVTQSSLSWKTCLDRARHDAGGDVITKRKRTASREKRRYCWSGAITKNIAMILNVTI